MQAPNIFSALQKHRGEAEFSFLRWSAGRSWLKFKAQSATVNKAQASLTCAGSLTVQRCRVKTGRCRPEACPPNFFFAAGFTKETEASVHCSGAGWRSGGGECCCLKFEPRTVAPRAWSCRWCWKGGGGGSHQQTPEPPESWRCDPAQVTSPKQNQDALFQPPKKKTLTF